MRKKQTKAERTMITRGRQTRSLEEWATTFELRTGVPAYVVKYRVLTLGWDIEKALFTPKKEIKYNPNRTPKVVAVKVDSPFRERVVCYQKGKMVRKSKITMIEWRGKTKSLYEWAIELAPQLGISIETMEKRVLWSCWDVDRAFSTPRQEKGTFIKG